MNKKTYLVLENGKIFEGYQLGAIGDVIGEIVFTTGMTGYLETLTDKSYYGQIILQTYPLIGNYGVIPEDFESSIVSAKGYIVKNICLEPSNFRSKGSLDDFLRERNIVGLCGIDTRALTIMLREKGTMNGLITVSPGNSDLERIRSFKAEKPVESVSIKETTVLNDEGLYSIAMIDLGYKENIVRELVKRNCRVILMPHHSPAEEILGHDPDGIMFSNGPGDPADNMAVIHNLKKLIKSGIPIFGICLGHQLLALAHGFITKKLKYGHRGANQPVKDLDTGRLYTTSQNHGYFVTEESIDASLAKLWHINMNDNTCEGIRYLNGPYFSVQFHPEGCGGPQDTGFLFDKFIGEIVKYGTDAKMSS
ncbi:MAG: carbamoyl phosphate synthase small subunit [Clostridiaceae bacterium]|jgi:carbamoyl-phosphate synthase small subunit|nr:carbamoyl phosphate synthase small subunit [Clostridiaceae bacterium]